jgi:hypothetical protein
MFKYIIMPIPYGNPKSFSAHLFVSSFTLNERRWTKLINKLFFVATARCIVLLSYKKIKHTIVILTQTLHIHFRLNALRRIKAITQRATMVLWEGYSLDNFCRDTIRC